MSSSKSTEFLARLTLALVLVGSLGAIEIDALPPMSKILEVQKRLEAYAQRQTRSTELTVADLHEALSEFEQWDQDFRDEMMQTKPLIHLLMDFLLIPMERFDETVGSDLDDDDDFDAEAEADGIPSDKHSVYIQRLELYYKKFRPAYLGKTIGSGSYLRAKKTDAAIESLLGIAGCKPLTRQLLNDAVIEYGAFASRFYQISAADDIFSQAQELEYLLNFLNRDWVRTFGKKIKPILESMQLQDSQLPEISQLFKKELYELGYIMKGDKIYRVPGHN